MKKKYEKIPHPSALGTYRHSICAFKFSRKIQTIVLCVKTLKYKKNLMQTLVLQPKLSVYVDHTNSQFSAT
jgi:hypothetical protein